MPQTDLIKVSQKKLKVSPNLADYRKTYQEFSWKEIEKELDWFPGKRINAAYNAIDRNALGWRKNKVALYWEGSEGEEIKYTFLELSSLSNRFANVLKGLGVKKGDRVFFFLPRIPELYIGFLGTLKTGAIAGTLFAAFGPQALEDRLGNSAAKILITAPGLLPRVEKIHNKLPKLEKIILIDEEKRKDFLEEKVKPQKTKKLFFYNELARAGADFKVTRMKSTDPAFMLYTSGTTGRPKGVIHTHGAILQEYLTTKWVLDIREDDVYWCVPPKSTVITNPGPKKIEELKIGNRILTHRGEFRPVKRLYSRTYKGPLVKIDTRYSNIPMYLTPNHKVLSGQRGKKAIGWIPAGKLTKKDYVLFPRVRKQEERENLSINEIVKNCWVKDGRVQRKKLRKRIKNQIKVDRQFMRLAGYYVAEGSLASRGAMVQFSFKKTEENWADDVVFLLREVFGFKGRKLFINNLVEVRVASIILAEFLEALFGRRSHQKRIPQWFLYLSEEKLAEFLKGFWRGDGDVDRDRFRFCTTSATLAYQLKLILHRLGLVTTFRRIPVDQIRDSKIGNRIIQAKHDCYYLAVGGESLEKLSKILVRPHPFLEKRSGSYQYAYVSPNFIWMPIRSIEEVPYDGKVLNLETDTGSYVLNNMAVQNCTADPGWVTGIAYGILGSWSNGASSLVFSGRFKPEKWYSLLEEYKVTVWYTAPTAIRMLAATGNELVKKYDLSSLRHLASVGEPLNPEAVWWGLRVFDLPFHDNWWQTETGGILIANYPCLDIKPGSMGKPIPGVKAGIVDDQGKDLPPGQEGNLVIRPGWPSMMKTIWRRPKKYESYFLKGWYLTGDRAYKDKDGYFWFVGRADDVILTAGERVGPFEVESALLEHPAVAEAAVVGKPDPIRGEIVKAFIALKPGFKESEALKQKIAQFVKKHLAGHAYPREIEFREKLPKTRSGKIVRRILKAQEMGLPIGDVSTLAEY